MEVHSNGAVCARICRLVDQQNNIIIDCFVWNRSAWWILQASTQSPSSGDVGRCCLQVQVEAAVEPYTGGLLHCENHAQSTQKTGNSAIIYIQPLLHLPLMWLLLCFCRLGISEEWEWLTLHPVMAPPRELSLTWWVLWTGRMVSPRCQAVTSGYERDLGLGSFPDYECMRTSPRSHTDS